MGRGFPVPSPRLERAPQGKPPAVTAPFGRARTRRRDCLRALGEERGRGRGRAARPGKAGVSGGAGSVWDWSRRNGGMGQADHQRGMKGGGGDGGGPNAPHLRTARGLAEAPGSRAPTHTTRLELFSVVGGAPGTATGLPGSPPLLPPSPPVHTPRGLPRLFFASPPRTAAAHWTLRLWRCLRLPRPTLPPPCRTWPMSRWPAS